MPSHILSGKRDLYEHDPKHHIIPTKENDPPRSRSAGCGLLPWFPNPVMGASFASPWERRAGEGDLLLERRAGEGDLLLRLRPAEGKRAR